MHKKASRFITLLTILSVTLFTSSVNVLAASQEITKSDLVNNTKDSAVPVECTISSAFSVKLPSEMQLENSNGEGTYSNSVGVKGDIDAGKAVIVEPETSVTLYDVTSRPTDDLPENEDDQNYPHKDAKVLTVEQAKTVWEQTEIDVNSYKNTDLEATVSDLSSGKWRGILNVSISYVKYVEEPGLYGSDGSFTPWSTLVSDGKITVADNVIKSGSDTSMEGRLVIEDGTTSIGSAAFQACSSLTSINIPESVISIEPNAFGQCRNLKNINIPESVTSIGDSAFAMCSNLTNINIPESVTSIKSYTFAGCSKLTNINIPESVTSIERYAFHNCSNLTNINIPESVTSIGVSAFTMCSNLTNINIPESVTSIDVCVFMSCSSLTSISIPENVTMIGSSAFVDCSNLADITFAGTQEQWSAITKESNWNTRVPATVVHCTDGDVTL